MSAKEMDSCLAKLRYVSEGDDVLAEDHNVPVDCIKVMRSWLSNICNTYGIDPSYVQELDPYIEKLRYVSSGDLILPEDHNTIVDALRKAREVIEKIETELYAKAYQEGVAAATVINAEVSIKPSIELSTTPTVSTEISVEKQS